MQVKKLWSLAIIILTLTLGNYQFAKLTQRGILTVLPMFSYMWSIVIPWVGIGLGLCLFDRSDNGLIWNHQKILQYWKSILSSFMVLGIGLAIFILFGITKYFHGVKSPIIFYLFTPIAEELIFRGWIYRQIEKTGGWPILLSALLFGLHHLQYFNYHLTGFALFQITYTFALGLILGKMRRDSGSIYSGLTAHIILNSITLMI